MKGLCSYMNEKSWETDTGEIHTKEAALSIIFFLICTVFTAQSYCKYLCAYCLCLFLIGQEAIWTRYRHICLRVESYRNTSAPTGHVFSDIDESSLCNPSKELVETFPFVRPSTHSHTLFS